MLNKLKASILTLVSLMGFIPLWIASDYSSRDYQLELAELSIKLWKEA